jgi:F420-dependent oxidoreductase-like protein
VKTAITIRAWQVGSGATWRETVDFVIQCDRMGVDDCWIGEAWSHDCVSPLAYLAARTNRIRLCAGVMQISGRTAAVAAMTAMTMAEISDDRFVLGLGVSGPQVVEALHGISFARPVERLEEYIDIIEMALSGRPLQYLGSHFQLPVADSEYGPLKLGVARDIPVYIAGLGPRTLELAGARAQGWVGTCFIPESASVYIEPIRKGLRSSSREARGFDLQAGGQLAFSDDLEMVLPRAKRSVAFLIGAMGSQTQNFYNMAYRRAGFEDEARKVQALWRDGRRPEAVRAVTDDMALLPSFLGTEEMVEARIARFRDAGITTVRADPIGLTLEERIDDVGRFLQCLGRVDA